MALDVNSSISIVSHNAKTNQSWNVIVFAYMCVHSLFLSFYIRATGQELWCKHIRFNLLRQTLCSEHSRPRFRETRTHKTRRANQSALPSQMLRWPNGRWANVTKRMCFKTTNWAGSSSAASNRAGSHKRLCDTWRFLFVLFFAYSWKLVFETSSCSYSEAHPTFYCCFLEAIRQWFLF